MSGKSAERRRFSRIHFEAVATLGNQHGQWHGKLYDISLKGALITRPHNWIGQAGDHFLVEIHPPENPFSIRMEMEVAHVEDETVGLNCLHIDIDSISHLRRLVELNVGDADVLNRELAELGGA